MIHTNTTNTEYHKDDESDSINRATTAIIPEARIDGIILRDIAIGDILTTQYIIMRLTKTSSNRTKALVV